MNSTGVFPKSEVPVSRSMTLAYLLSMVHVSPETWVDRQKGLSAP